MNHKNLCIALLLILILAFQVNAAENNMSVYQALKICEINEVGNYTSIINQDGFWKIKAQNLNNQKSCELRISQSTQQIVAAKNVSPREMVMGENTYEYANNLIARSNKFIDTGKTCNGFKIYDNHDPYFKMRRAIFIIDGNRFAAYYIIKGPGLIR